MKATVKIEKMAQTKKITLITVIKGRIDEEVIESIRAEKLTYGVYLTSKKLFDVQQYLYGVCGFSMLSVICTKLDKYTIETLNENRL